MKAQTVVRPTCRHCGRDRVDHCDTCRGCWHVGLDPDDGERLLGCLLHDRLLMVAPFRWTTWQVAA